MYFLNVYITIKKKYRIINGKNTGTSKIGISVQIIPIKIEIILFCQTLNSDDVRSRGLESLFLSLIGNSITIFL